MTKQLLFSVTRHDCEWAYKRGSGKGGQKRNKTSSAVQCFHRPSGAMGCAEDGRSQSQNRAAAFRRMAETKEFRAWVMKEVARVTGLEAEIKRRVEDAVKPENLRIEVLEDDRWVVEATIE